VTFQSVSAAHGSVAVAAFIGLMSRLASPFALEAFIASIASV